MNDRMSDKMSEMDEAREARRVCDVREEIEAAKARKKRKDKLTLLGWVVRIVHWTAALVLAVNYMQNHDGSFVVAWAIVFSSACAVDTLSILRNDK